MRVNIFRKAYSVGGVVLLLEFLTQFYVIAASMFTTMSRQIAEATNADVATTALQNVEPFTAVHAVNGVFIIPSTILVLVGLSFGARYPWRTTALTALLMVLMVVQFALAVVGFLGVPAIGGLHGINALVMVGLGGWLTWKNWAFGRQHPPPPVAISHAEVP